MSEDAVSLVEEQPGVCTLLLNRPDQHNAFDDAMIAAMSRACEQVAQSDSVRVLVLASRGRHFSAGADLGWMRRMADYSQADNLRDAQALARLLQQLDTLPQVTIARVQGAAFGGAVGLVSCCDLAVATPESRFSLSEVKLGLIPATISPYVIRAIGERAARRYFATAEPFDADTARQLGLLSELADTAALDGQIQAWIDAILANGPLAVKAAKQLIRRVAGVPIEQALIDETCHWIADIRVSEEGQAGLQAFLNKRPPPWQEA